MLQILQILDKGADRKCLEVNALRVVLSPRQMYPSLLTPLGITQGTVLHADARTPQLDAAPLAYCPTIH